MQAYSEDYRIWRRYAFTRQGMHLVGIIRAALPVTLLNVDVVAHERKRLDLLDEFVLRCTDAGLDTIPQIAQLCGLDDELISNVTLSRVADGSLQYLPHTESFKLTPIGHELVEDPVEIQPVLSEYRVAFDRLAWDVSDYPANSLITKTDAVSGCRTLLPSSRTDILKPDELAPTALHGVIEWKSRREFVILEVKTVKVSSYKYLPVDLLVFKGDEDNSTSFALVIEGKLSGQHDSALSKWNAQELLDMRLDWSEEEYPSGLSPTSPRHLLDEKHALFTGKLDQVPPITVVRHFQHHELLYMALSTATKRLEISTTALSEAVIDDQFCRVLEGALRRGVMVEITYDAQVGLSRGREASQRVSVLQQKYQNFSMNAIIGHRVERLTFDDWQVEGAFPWLNHRTHPHQVIRHYTSALQRLSTRAF